MFEAASAAMKPVIDKELATEGMTPAGADTVWLMFESGDDKGKVMPVTGDEFVIGRDEAADLQILDTRVSRRHASLKVMPGGNAELRDMDSANGTMVNGAPVKSAVLTGTERLRVGDTEFTFYPGRPGAGQDDRRDHRQGPAAQRRHAPARPVGHPAPADREEAAQPDVRRGRRPSWPS